MHKRFTKIKMLMIFLILIVSLLTFTPSVNAWGTDPHEGMAENIAITFGLNMDAYNQLKLGSTHPDHIGQNPNDHAYLVDAWPFTIGSAPYWAEKFATDARTDYNYGRYSSAYYNLGQASHYTVDVSNPFHSSISGVSYHGAYEGPVSDQFYGDPEGNYYCQYLTTGTSFCTPSDCVKRTATEAGEDATAIADRIRVNPSGWMYEEFVVGNTAANIAVGSMYTNTLYYRMTGLI